MSFPAISQEFGSSLKTYNLINEAISQASGQLKGEYDQKTRTITISHSSNLSSSYLHEVLYRDSLTAEKNLVARFSFEDLSEKAEVIEMKKTISIAVIDAMSRFFNKHEMGSGIWYPNDYHKHLNECGKKMPVSFFSGYAKEEFFEKTSCSTFILKEGKKASEAILSFLKGPTIADCGNAIVACFYKCILDIVGEEKFDCLFGSDPNFMLAITQLLIQEKSPISDLVEFTEASYQKDEGILGKRPLEVGDMCYFAGVRWYVHKHPEGFGGGYNVIYIDDDEEGIQLFLAHGFEKPFTEKEINQRLLELYNQERSLQCEQHIAKENKSGLFDRKINTDLKDHYTISLDKMEKNPSKFMKGYLANSVIRLNAEGLVMLKKWSESTNVKPVFDQLKLERLKKSLLKSIDLPPLKRVEREDPSLQPLSIVQWLKNKLFF